MMERLCCMRLNTAGVVIGWIGATLSMISIIVIALALSRVDELAKVIFDQMNDSNISQEAVSRALVVILSLYLTVNLINMIASALLVAGTIKERHLMIVPWLLNSGVSMFINAIYFIYFLVVAITAAIPFGSIFASLISVSISLIFQYVIWYAIYSLFKKLQSDREQRQTLLATTGSSYPSYTKI